MLCTELRGIKIKFCHVKRDRNAWADWLVRCADALERNVQLTDLVEELP